MGLQNNIPTYTNRKHPGPKRLSAGHTNINSVWGSNLGQAAQPVRQRCRLWHWTNMIMQWKILVTYKINVICTCSNTQKQKVDTITQTNVNDYLCFGVITVNSSSIVNISQYCMELEVSSNLSNNCHLDMCQFVILWDKSRIVLSLIYYLRPCFPVNTTFISIIEVIRWIFSCCQWQDGQNYNDLYLLEYKVWCVTAAVRTELWKDCSIHCGFLTGNRLPSSWRFVNGC